MDTAQNPTLALLGGDLDIRERADPQAHVRIVRRDVQAEEAPGRVQSQRHHLPVARRIAADCVRSMAFRSVL